MDDRKTLGKVISERRQVLGLSLKDLGRLVYKEDSTGVSARYIHDIERDRRVPAPHVLGQMAKALGVDALYLEAVIGRPPFEIVLYLKAHPESGASVAALFARAHDAGFVAWDDVAPYQPPESGPQRAPAEE